MPGAKYLVHARLEQEDRWQAGLQMRQRQHLPRQEVHLRLQERQVGAHGSQHAPGHGHLIIFSRKYNKHNDPISWTK